MRIQRIVALVLLFGIVLGYLLAPAFSFSSAPDSKLQAFPSSKGWNQVDKLQGILASNQKYEVLAIIGSPTILRDVKEPQKTLYIAIGLETKYRPSDKDILRDFVQRGGKAIIADDHGFADDMSNEYGVTYYGQTMWDDTNYLNNATFPLIVAELPNGDPYVLVLNDPTGLANQSYEDPSQGDFCYTIIAHGSEKSYVDRNDNRIIDPSDAHEDIPVCIQVEYNIKKHPEATPGGKLIFISDTAPFTNDLLVNMEQLLGMMNNPATRKYKDINLDSINNKNVRGSNQEFVKAIITNLSLPSGGKIIFDESRHPQSNYVAAVYGTIASLTIITSDPLEAGLLSIGILLILVVVVFRARDKESWIHRFDISSIHRRALLPDTRTVQVDHLRKALLQKTRMLNSLSQEELRALNPAQLAQMIKDADLNELLLNEQKTYAPEEVRALTAKLRAWGKV